MEGDAALAAIKRDSAWTAAAQLNILQGADLTLTRNSTVSTIAGEGTLTMQAALGQGAMLTLTSPSTFGGTLALQGEGEAKLTLDGAEESSEMLTLTDGAKLQLWSSNAKSGIYASGKAERLVLDAGATVDNPVCGVDCVVQFNADAIIDVTTSKMPLSVSGGIILPESGKVVVRAKSLCIFLIFKDSEEVENEEGENEDVENEGGIANPEGFFVVEVQENIELLNGATICSCPTLLMNYVAVGLMKIDVSNVGNVEISEDDLAAMTQNAFMLLAVNCETSETPLQPSNPNVLACFEGISTVGYDYDEKELIVTYYFGIGNVTILPRKVNSEIVQQVAVAVKVEDGNGDAAYLRGGTEGTKIHLSTDGKPRDAMDKDWKPATALSVEELGTAGLTNGEGIYWYWAGGLPTIEDGATSTTLSYDVKAVK